MSIILDIAKIMVPLFIIIGCSLILDAIIEMIYELYKEKQTISDVLQDFLMYISVALPLFIAGLIIAFISDFSIISVVYSCIFPTICNTSVLVFRSFQDKKRNND